MYPGGSICISVGVASEYRKGEKWILEERGRGDKFGGSRQQATDIGSKLTPLSQGEGAEQDGPFVSLPVQDC